MKKVPAIGLPRGYKFEIIEGQFDEYSNGTHGYLDNQVDVRLYHGKKCIGRIDLECESGRRAKIKSYVTHSFLSPKYRNKGLGARMYAKAIAWCLARGYKVQSYYSPSAKAQRVWMGKYLASKFCITNKKKPYWYGGSEFQWSASLKNKLRKKK